MTAVVVAAAGETSVEVVLPEGRSCLQLCCSGWSWVVGVDAVGGPPHGDFTNDGEVLAAARRRPIRLWAVLTGLIPDVIGKVDHQPGRPRQYQQFGDSNEALLAPAGQAMLDAAQLRPGERVLDVGCGLALPRSKRRRGPRRPAGSSASTSPQQSSSPPGSASQPPVWTTSS